MNVRYEPILISRLTPSMPANLAQNLDRAASRQNDETPAPPNSQRGALDPAYAGGRSKFESLPKIDVSGKPVGEVSPQYSIPSGVEEYLKGDYPTINEVGVSTQQVGPPMSDSYNPYSDPSHRGPPPGRDNSYANNGAQPRNEPYNVYTQPQYAFQPRADQPQRPNSSHGYSQPPPAVDYSKAPEQRGRSAQPSSSGRPLSQAMSNLSLAQGAGTFEPADFLDMPDPAVPTFNDLNDPLPPPSRPFDRQGRQSPRLRLITNNQNLTPQRTATPPILATPSDHERETEINSQRENALRTNDPNIALGWAEKTYLYVSVSLEDIRM